MQVYYNKYFLVFKVLQNIFLKKSESFFVRFFAGYLLNILSLLKISEWCFVRFFLNIMSY